MLSMLAIMIGAAYATVLAATNISARPVRLQLHAAEDGDAAHLLLDMDVKQPRFRLHTVTVEAAACSLFGPCDDGECPALHLKTTTVRHSGDSLSMAVDVRLAPGYAAWARKPIIRCTFDTTVDMFRTGLTMHMSYPLNVKLGAGHTAEGEGPQVRIERAGPVSVAGVRMHDQNATVAVPCHLSMELPPGPLARAAHWLVSGAEASAKASLTYVTGDAPAPFEASAVIDGRLGCAGSGLGEPVLLTLPLTLSGRVDLAALAAALQGLAQGGTVEAEQVAGRRVYRVAPAPSAGPRTRSVVVEARNHGSPAAKLLGARHELAWHSAGDARALLARVERQLARLSAPWLDTASMLPSGGEGRLYVNQSFHVSGRSVVLQLLSHENGGDVSYDVSVYTEQGILAATGLNVTVGDHHLRVDGSLGRFAARCLVSSQEAGRLQLELGLLDGGRDIARIDGHAERHQLGFSTALLLRHGDEVVAADLRAESHGATPELRDLEVSCGLKASQAGWTLNSSASVAAGALSAKVDIQDKAAGWSSSASVVARDQGNTKSSSVTVSKEGNELVSLSMSMTREGQRLTLGGEASVYDAKGHDPAYHALLKASGYPAHATASLDVQDRGQPLASLGFSRAAEAFRSYVRITDPGDRTLVTVGFLSLERRADSALRLSCGASEVRQGSPHGASLGFMSLLLTDEEASLQVAEKDSALVDASVRVLSDGDEGSLAIGLAVMSPGGGPPLLRGNATGSTGIGKASHLSAFLEAGRDLLGTGCALQVAAALGAGRRGNELSVEASFRDDGARDVAVEVRADNGEARVLPVTLSVKDAQSKLLDVELALPKAHGADIIGSTELVLDGMRYAAHVNASQGSVALGRSGFKSMWLKVSPRVGPTQAAQETKGMNLDVSLLLGPGGDLAGSSVHADAYQMGARMEQRVAYSIESGLAVAAEALPAWAEGTPDEPPALAEAAPPVEELEVLAVVADEEASPSEEGKAEDLSSRRLLQVPEINLPEDAAVDFRGGGLNAPAPTSTTTDAYSGYPAPTPAPTPAVGEGGFPGPGTPFGISRHPRQCVQVPQMLFNSMAAIECSRE